MTVQEEQQIRIRELEKEIARLHSQIKEQRYGLTWLDVPEAFETESENKIPILEEVKDKAVDNGGDTAPHIIIEGDNYHALTCLNYTHRGKIDVIYIDPPYNTGSDGFTYKDKRILDKFPDGSPVPKDHPLRHSYWLSFMSKRLELAKNLLSDKGVIFISIDDNEQANLKLLCDKVFGEDNFVNNIIWQKKFSPQNDAKWFSDNHDFILCYAKKKEIWHPNLLSRSESTNSRYSNPDNDPRGPWASTDLAVKTYSKDYDYPITTPSGKVVTPSNGRCWMTSKDKMQLLIEDNRIWFGKKGSNMPRYKTFLSEVQQGIVPLTIWLNDEVGHNQSAKQELKKIFYDIHLPFETPKPVLLLERMEQIASSKSSTILDFFAGSGTTLHATMKLNAEDGGHRQCILVQQREGDNNICESVTYERNRRVMCGYTNAKGEAVEGLGGRMKYYRTAFVGKNASRTATDADRVELSLKAGYLLALGENTLEEICHTDTYQIFADVASDGKSGILPLKYTAIFFTENYAKLPEFVAKIESLRVSNGADAEVAAYIFCWGQPDVFEGEFNSLRGISLKAIPQPILDVYKSINQ